MSNFVLIAVAIVFVVSEWLYRARRDGKAEATKAMIFAALILLVGLAAAHFLGSVVGPLVVLGIMVLALIWLFVSRRKKR
jgi:LPXTG-motif cell wall-anchored protein